MTFATVRRRFLLICLVAALIAVGTVRRSVTAQDSVQPAKYALLVGVAKYQHASMNKTPLEYPELDAQAMAKVFRESGYTVDLLLGSQATQKAIREKLASFNRRGNSDGVAVIGLFGHGTEPEGTKTAYFCPFDTTLQVIKDRQGRVVPDEQGRDQLQEDPESLIAMPELLEALKVSPAGNRALFADCCRNDPNRPRGRAFGSQLKASDIPENTAAFFACSAGQQAYEHKDWGHGAFTKCLLDEIKTLSATGKVRMAALTDRVQENVERLVAAKSNSRDRQTPYPLIFGNIDLQLIRVVPKPMPMPNSVPMSTASTTGASKTAASKTVPKSEVPFVTKPANKSPDRPRRTLSEPDHFDFVLRSRSLNEANESQTVWSYYVGTRVIERNSIGMDMVLLPPGKFTMGSPYTEKPRHNDEAQIVTALTKPFFVGMTEVTQAQWKAVMKSEPWSNQTDVQEGDNYPAVCISWNDANEFCATLSKKEQEKYRLLTEAEWEYACRAGSTAQFAFPEWSKDITVGAIVKEGKLRGNFPAVMEVGTADSNGFNLTNMHGNVWEWCQDVYSNKLPGKENPLVQVGSENRVIRGGSVETTAEFARSASRSQEHPNVSNPYLGFRVARVAVIK